MAMRFKIVLVFFACAIAKLAQGGIDFAPDCDGIPNCSGNPCLTATCPNHPAAMCKLGIDDCGNCKAVFYTPDGDLSASECTTDGGSCVPQPCKPDPCLQASCPNQPGAQCRSDTCKGCLAIFTYRGKVLAEDECMLGSGPIATCPDGSLPVTCAKDPCHGVTCFRMPDAECRPNYCGGCSAHFYVDGRKIENRLCIGIEPCPPDVPQAGCLSRPGEKCLGKICPRYPDATCLIDGCGGCHVIFFDRMRRLTEEDCSGCPARNCNPCEHAKCPDHTSARCEPRRCGMCKAVFYGRDRNEIESCCKSEMCKDGSMKFHCKRDPCQDASCVAYPGATCTANYCGGCKAEFSSNGRKLTDADCVPMEICPRNLPQALCVGGKCLGETCPMYPEAQCKIDGCNGCRVIFYYGGKRLTREECHGCPLGEAKVPGCDNPCDGAVCQGYPNARCESNTCGECKPVFYGTDRRVINNCNTGGGLPNCPNGQPRAICIDDPCRVKKCPNVPDAQCRPDYCGPGCKANFYYPSGRRISEFQCVEKEICPGDLPVAGCVGPDACLGKKCPNYPDAECWIDSCNVGCTVVFYDGRRRLTDEDCNGCPPGLFPVNNCEDPCKNALCPLYPEARCEARRCGLCGVAFYDLSRKEIKDCCGKSEMTPECPDGETLHQCAINPCDFTKCPAEPSARCIPNYCGGCKANFFIGDILLTYSDCGLCENGKQPINCGVAPLCFVARCQAHPDAECRSSNCGECKTWFVDRNGNTVDCDEPKGCPPDKPLSVCKRNPCMAATCPANPRAYCKANYCGGCNAEFFFDGRQLTDMECVKNPDDCALFTTCLANACNCPAHPKAQCVMQYCAPNTCKPLYFDSNGMKLSYEDCGLCANGEQSINCGFVPQCRFDTCAAHPDAKCRSTNCGTCKTWFEDSNGNTVDCEVKLQCKVPEDIPQGVVAPNDRTMINLGEHVQYRCNDGFNMRLGSKRRCIKRRNRARLAGLKPQCYDERCPRPSGGGTCQSKCDMNSDCGYNGMCCWNGCGTQCMDIPNVCPNGDPPVQCYIDPCLDKTCARVPGATCKPNYCGGCLQDWYMGTRKLTPNDCFQPDLRCPPLGIAVPVCVDQCLKDSDCNILEACCFNGCGHLCQGY